MCPLPDAHSKTTAVGMPIFATRSQEREREGEREREKELRRAVIVFIFIFLVSVFVFIYVFISYFFLCAPLLFSFLSSSLLF